jgi:predicted enzyme related to lactoylglutathione lyase
MDMKNLCAMVEIAVEDFGRAKQFYESILGIKITEMNILDTQIGMFPMEGYSNWGCISKCDQHRPSRDGTLIYLNADSDIDGMLEKVKSAGGEILTPKTKLSDEFGFIAVFVDTEGNRIALHALK